MSSLLICSLLFSALPPRAFAVEENNSYGELALAIMRPEAKAATEFMVKLTDNSSSVVKEATLSAPKNAEKSEINLNNISNGDYTLTVDAAGYLSYTQNLNFDGRCINLTLHNNASVNEGRDGNQNKFFGVMPVGDINSDKVIDDTDADLVADSIGADYNPDYDLNGDQKVDLTDLTIVVRNESGVQLTTPEHTVSSKALAESVQAAPGSGTNVKSGSIAALMDKTQTNTAVQLEPVNGTLNESNPIELVLTTNEKSPVAGMVTAEAITITPPAGSLNFMTAGSVIVEGTDEETKESVTLTVPVSSTHRDVVYKRAAMAQEVTVEKDGTVVINLGRRVAIKKVTIRVTATANQNNLAEIAKVEFLSDFSERVPEPQLSVPTVQSASNTESDGQGYKNLTVTWNSQTNVTGYEVEVSGEGYHKSALTENTSYTFQGDSFNGTVKSFHDYTIRVRSVSGEWKSDWSEPYKHTVTCNTKPPQPKSVTAAGADLSLQVAWDCKFDAEWFTLYYKESGAENYTAVENITSSSYTIPNLKGGVKYTVYVVAHNRNGDSPKSDNAEGMPTTATGVDMPKYKLLNTPDPSGMASTHITQISGNANKTYTIYLANGSTVTNTSATPDDWNALLDDNPNTYVYIPDWDSGFTYANFRGPKIQLDKAYTMDTIRLTPVEGAAGLLNVVRVQYKDASGDYQSVNTRCNQRYDSQNRRYFEIIMEKPITTDYLEIRTSTSNYSSNHAISEVRLYEYDDLEDTIAALFEDDMRTALKDNVAKEDIQTLIDRTNETDPVSGEYHPHKQTMLEDLNYAMQLLEESVNPKILTVDNQITANGNPKTDFAQELSDYQPLGVTAAAGDTVVIYISDGQTAKGQNVNLKLVATQVHPEVTAWQSGAIQLKAGRNEITIPKIGSYAKESGGPLYLQYTGKKGEKEYQVRASGGTAIPVLQLDGVADTERADAISAYVAELEDYVNKLQGQHDTIHAASDNANVNSYSYANTDCILNATEITMENMMFSLPATQVLAGLGSGDKESNLSQAIKAMEQEIDYFYQFKGMNKAATDNDAYPYTRLNIRYHKMFTGAFMYAGGKHIGIEYGSVPGLFTTTPVTTDANGQKTGGQYSGWGIAHEIGHCINSKTYQRVEVTNNVFAQMAQTNETNGSFRTLYDKVYKAVATGTTGHTGDLAVQLAMYWQLHLAYDNDFTYKAYSSIDDQQQGLFYARLESYLRTPSKAPHPFTAADGDQLFMQAACAASNENILGFFKAWGFTPDNSTETYAANFNKEDVKVRKIQYIDDDSRLYRIQGGPGMSQGTAVDAEITNAIDSRINGNRVKISLKNNNTNDNAMLGYEICRNGKMVAFVTADKNEYEDIVTTENNKAFVYTVTGIDRLLNETEALALPEIKVCHDGAISKDGWTATTNMASEEDKVVEKDDNDPDRGTTTQGVDKESAIPAAFDNKTDTVYYGNAGSGSNRPYVTLNLGGVEQVTALKYTPVTNQSDDLYKMRLFGYRIETSLDGTNWETVKEGDAYTGTASNPSSWAGQPDVIYNPDGSYTMYFNKQQSDGSMDPFMYTYDAAYIRLTATNMSSIAIAELDVLGPTSDNVELIPEGFGKLKSDYIYNGEDKIPADSIVFYGAYKGNPAYNVVLLRGQNGKTLDGSQLIFADVPKQGALGETSDGRWFFWLEPETKTDSEGTEYNEQDQLNGLLSVQAELYRVQDAQTMTGQRLTSTSLRLAIPEAIPEISITADTSNVSDVTTRIETPELNPVSESPTGIQWTKAAVPGAYYGDTGAALTPETENPLHWTNTTVNSTEYNICVKEESSVAACTEIVVWPKDMQLAVRMNDVSNLYQRHCAFGDSLKLYTVARQGSIGDGHVTGTISGIKGNAVLTASHMSFLKENNGAYEADSIDINAKVEFGESSEKPEPGTEPETKPEPEQPSGTSTSGGGSASAPTKNHGGATSGNSVPTPVNDNSSTSSDSNGNGNTKVILSTVQGKDGKASAVMDEKAANDLISQAEKDKSKQATVTVDAPLDVSGVSMSMPVSAAKNLTEKTDAGMSIDVKIAVFLLSSKAVENIAGRSKDTIGVNAEKINGAVKVSVQSDGKDVEGLTGVTVLLPVKQNAGTSTVAIVVNENGSETVLKKAVAVNGSMAIPMTGTTTIRIKNNDKVFSDSTNHWAKDSIAFVSSRELFNGVGESEFAPNATMTRAMLATVLHRLENAPKAGAQGFPDVPAGKWYTDAVAWASDKGIVQGDTHGRFNPEGAVTREQLATMLYRYAGATGVDTDKKESLERFPDMDKVSNYAQGALEWAVGCGIVGGRTNSNLDPTGNATRAEVSTMLMRLVYMINS